LQQETALFHNELLGIFRLGFNHFVRDFANQLIGHEAISALENDRNPLLILTFLNDMVFNLNLSAKCNCEIVDLQCIFLLRSVRLSDVWKINELGEATLIVFILVFLLEEVKDVLLVMSLDILLIRLLI